MKSTPCSDGRAPSACGIGAFGFGVPHRFDLQQPTVAGADQVLPVVERGAPAGAFEVTSVALLQHRTVLTLPSDPRSAPSQHRDIMNERTLWSVSADWM